MNNKIYILFISIGLIILIIYLLYNCFYKIKEGALGKIKTPKIKIKDITKPFEQAGNAISDTARQVEEAARREAEEAQRIAEEQARQAEEAARRAAEEARRQAEEQARRATEEARQQAEEQARRVEEARQQAEEQARRVAEEARRQAEIAAQEARKQAELIAQQLMINDFFEKLLKPIDKLYLALNDTTKILGEY